MKENENENISIPEFEKAPEFTGTGTNLNPLQRKKALMTDEEYLVERLEAQMDWYDRKASLYQKKYKFIKRWEIAIAASIPVLIGFASMSVLENTVLIKETVKLADGALKVMPIFNMSHLFQIIAALSGVVIIILKGINDLEDYFKNWKEYRLTAENLRQERYKYLTKTEPYDEIDSFPLLVETVEQILNNETQKWKLVTKQSNEIADKATASVEALFKNMQNNPTKEDNK